MKFNEDSRVKIPAVLHFLRLGYKYQSKAKTNIDSKNNIFVDIFAESIRKINNVSYKDEVINNLIKEISTLTDNSVDKGQAFYERLTGYHPIKLIDLKEPENNDYRVVTELTFQGERNNFRPDITILINGIPLGFIEVKKPNNKDGIQAEFKRMKKRLGFKDCIHFFNQFQLLGFSNNQLYNDAERIRLQGSFYTTPNGNDIKYNLFREEQELHVNEFIKNELINEVISDNNVVAIKGTSEFITNLSVNTPCNKFITSVFSIQRLNFLLRYGIVYVNSQLDGLNKHIIRYPQYFAIQELQKKIEDEDFKKGVIWHTQGSGKTALAYFTTNVLRDYYQKRDVITKFYFVVDRLDLLLQASTEFSNRGMSIARIDSREDFANNIKSTVIIGTGTQQGNYKETMNVANIQKFSEDSTVDLSCSNRVQRIYFIDEVHRSYRMKGKFLANLLGADPNGIFIGLTGTPLIKEDSKTIDVFDTYIHKYYYNKSISDGYTLKIKKENIATKFRSDIKSMLNIPEDGNIPKASWNEITSKPIFVERLCEYIQEDFTMFVDEIHKDKSLGFMIVASTSEQARLIHEWFQNNSLLRTALVLHDEEANKDKQEGFRGKKNKVTGIVESKYDGVIVFEMLLTGFDAPRLKRLYLLRERKEHSLLQTLARVNRPYKNMKYGYVVDFVDITEQYEETNRRYLEELKEDIKDENDFSDVETFFVDPQKARQTIRDITNNALFIYMPNIEVDLEAFSQQIEPLTENQLREIRSYLFQYRDSYNELRMSHEDVSSIPIDRIDKAFYEVSNRINLKVAERALDEEETDIDKIDFSVLLVEFLKVGEIDLEFDAGNDILERINNIKNALSSNCDKKDKEFMDICTNFKRILKKFKEEVKTTKDIQEVIKDLENIYREIQMLNNKNSSLTKVYSGDESCMRIHKRLLQEFGSHFNEGDICSIMIHIMSIIETTICHLPNPNEAVVKREMARPVRDAFRDKGYKLSAQQVESIVYLFIDEKFTSGQ